MAALETKTLKYEQEKPELARNANFVKGVLQYETGTNEEKPQPTASDASTTTLQLNETGTHEEKPQPAASDASTTTLQLNGRCGPLFGGRRCECRCDCEEAPVYCNEVNGWCGDTEGHRDAQPSDEYDSVDCDCRPEDCTEHTTDAREREVLAAGMPGGFRQNLSLLISTPSETLGYLQTCPWLTWSNETTVLYPRGAGCCAHPDHTHAFQKMTAAALRGEIIFWGQGGTALASHAGGDWSSDDDLDIDLRQIATSAQTEPNTEEWRSDLLARFPSLQGHAVNSYEGATTIPLAPPSCGERPCGEKQLKDFIQEYCLCQYSGTLMLCEKAADKGIHAWIGPTWWIPMPYSKHVCNNESRGDLTFYAEPEWVFGELNEDASGGQHDEFGQYKLDPWAGWRQRTVEDMENIDANGDGEITYSDLLESKGDELNHEWIAAVEKSDPCILAVAIVALQKTYTWLRRVNDKINEFIEEFQLIMNSDAQTEVVAKHQKILQSERQVRESEMLEIKRKFDTNDMLIPSNRPQSAGACRAHLRR